MSQFPYDPFIYGLTSEFSYSFLTFWLQQHRTIPLHGVIVSIILVSFDLVIIFYPNSMKSSLKYIHIWNWKYLRNTHIYVCMYACLHALYILSICVYIYIYKYMFMLAYVHWCMEMSFIMTYKHICLLLLIPFSLHLFPFSCQDHHTSAFMV